MSGKVRTAGAVAAWAWSGLTLLAKAYLTDSAFDFTKDVLSGPGSVAKPEEVAKLVEEIRSTTGVLEDGTITADEFRELIDTDPDLAIKIAKIRNGSDLGAVTEADRSIWAKAKKAFLPSFMTDGDSGVTKEDIEKALRERTPKPSTQRAQVGETEQPETSDPAAFEPMNFVTEIRGPLTRLAQSSDVQVVELFLLIEAVANGIRKPGFPVAGRRRRAMLQLLQNGS